MPPDATALRNRVLLFAALIGWCGALLGARVVGSGSSYYLFLVWNLFLAVIPAAVAPLFAAAMTGKSSLAVRAGTFAVWLVFLPNAPYLVSDFVHLIERPPVPVWYDIALLLSFAGTGMLLGYCSLGDVQAGVAHRHGPAAGWATVVVVLLLSGFGIYLGRFLRWNSWDVLTHPVELTGHILDRLLHPLSHPRTVAVTVIYGGGLVLGYVALRVLGGRPAAVPIR
jgi:uncharacterized membrane protein